MDRDKRMMTIVVIAILALIIFTINFGWQELKRRREKPSPALTVSIAEPEKAAPPVEKKPAAKKKAAKKVAKKKPPVPLTAAIREPVREEREWERWNAAPYAASREEACKKAPEAIDSFAFPAPVKELFKKLLGADCNGGTEAWLTPGMPLEQMLSGKSGKKPPHLLNKVTVAELPVLQSPDGRPYRNGAVAETAKALAWRVEHEGRAYMLYLPFVCWNWAWKFGVPPLLPPHPPVLRPAPVLVPPPSSVQEECATVEYAVVPGDEVRFAVLAQRRLPASACWRLCDGADCAAPPSPCDVCDWIGPMSLLPEGFEPLHTGRYVARSAKQSLRLPREARVNFVALCVEREGLGGSNSWIVDPDAWRRFGKGTVILVPYGGIVWPVWGEETIWPGLEYSPGY